MIEILGWGETNAQHGTLPHLPVGATRHPTQWPLPTKVSGGCRVGAGVCGMAVWVWIRGEGLPTGRASRGPRTGDVRHHRREGERVNGGNTGVQTYCPGSNTVTVDRHSRHKTAACHTTRTVQRFVPNKTAQRRLRASSSLRSILNIRGLKCIWCWDHETAGAERPARGAR